MSDAEATAKWQATAAALSVANGDTREYGRPSKDGDKRKGKPLAERVTGRSFCLSCCRFECSDVPCKHKEFCCFCKNEVRHSSAYCPDAISKARAADGSKHTKTRASAKELCAVLNLPWGEAAPAATPVPGFAPLGTSHVTGGTQVTGLTQLSSYGGGMTYDPAVTLQKQQQQLDMLQQRMQQMNSHPGRRPPKRKSDDDLLAEIEARKKKKEEEEEKKKEKQRKVAENKAKFEKDRLDAEGKRRERREAEEQRKADALSRPAAEKEADSNFADFQGKYVQDFGRHVLNEADLALRKAGLSSEAIAQLRSRLPVMAANWHVAHPLPAVKDFYKKKDGEGATQEQS